jgi:hypothetical protein
VFTRRGLDFNCPALGAADGILRSAAFLLVIKEGRASKQSIFARLHAGHGHSAANTRCALVLPHLAVKRRHELSSIIACFFAGRGNQINDTDLPK